MNECYYQQVEAHARSQPQDQQAQALYMHWTNQIMQIRAARASGQQVPQADLLGGGGAAAGPGAPRLSDANTSAVIIVYSNASVLNSQCWSKERKRSAISS